MLETDGRYLPDGLLYVNLCRLEFRNVLLPPTDTEVQDTGEEISRGQWRTGGVGGFNHPPTEIPKARQNRAKLNPIVKSVKNC